MAVKEKVVILGSCVSRDPIELFLGASVVLKEYFARSSLASLGQASCVDESLLSNIESPFQRRMVRFDMDKSCLDTVACGDYDLLLIDLIDERFSVVEKGASFLTYSPELKKGLNGEGVKAYSAYSRKKLSLWEQGLNLLSKAVNEGGKKKIVINKVFWSNVTNHLTGERLLNVSDDEVKRANFLLEGLYGKLEKAFPEASVIEYGVRDLVADKDHKWGESPYHFGREYVSTFCFYFSKSLDLLGKGGIGGKPDYKASVEELKFFARKKYWKKALDHLNDSVEKGLPSLSESSIGRRIVKNAESSKVLEERVFTQSLKEREDRVKAAVKKELVVHQLLSTSMICSGLINLAVFKHDLLTDKGKVSIIEKLFSPHDKSRVEKEVFLHSLLLSKNLELNTPKMLGEATFFGLPSLYFEYSSGSEPSFDDWVNKLRGPALGQLWSKAIVKGEGKPDSSLLDSAKFKVDICQLCNDLVVGGGFYSYKFSRYLRDKKDLESFLNRRLPNFVMHGDLSCGNVLLEGERITFIDWDKWSIEKLGFGSRGDWLDNGESNVLKSYGLDRSFLTCLDSYAFFISLYINSASYFLSRHKPLQLERLCRDFFYRLNSGLING